MLLHGSQMARIPGFCLNVIASTMLKRGRRCATSLALVQRRRIEGAADAVDPKGEDEVVGVQTEHQDQNTSYGVLVTTKTEAAGGIPVDGGQILHCGRM